MNNIQEATIMFTGGQDSTSAACKLLKLGYKLHLLSFNNGFCIRMSKASDRAIELSKQFGNENITYRTIDSKETMQLLKNALKKFRQKYKSPLVFDLLCRFAMEINTVIYCKNNNIPIVADGNNIAQNQIFIQQKQYLDIVDNFYKQFGIDSIHPVYFSAKKRNINLQVLSENGLHNGNKLFEKFNISSQLLNQPFCLWAPVSFLFTSPLRNLGFEKLFGLPLEKAIDIRKKLNDTAKNYIQTKIYDK